MKLRSALIAVLALAGLAGLQARAHHSFAAEFDANLPVDFTGIVTKIEWMNPHTFFYVDVEDGGEYNNWAVELGSPNGLMRRGWTRNSLKIGDEVSIAGSRARDGSFKANARAVTLADGTRMFSGSSDPDAADGDQ